MDLNAKIDGLIERFMDGSGKKSDITRSKTKALLLLWICTVTVMWLYVLFCLFAFGPGIVTTLGSVFSFLHTLAPILFYRTHSLSMTGMLISFTGLGFQAVFCLYSGGIFSPAAIWFSLHPVLLAFFANIPVILASVIINALLVSGLWLTEHFGMLPPDTLPEHYRYVMNLSSYIGLDVLIALFTIVTVMIHQKNAKTISKKKEMIENLVRILSHDICNPLTISKGQIVGLRKNKIPLEKALSKMSIANDQILQIVDSVRYWMAHQEDKLMVKAEHITCKEIVDHIELTFLDRMANKGIAFKVLNDNFPGVFVVGDRNAILFQVINNLFSNAIKFTHPNTEISILFREEENHIIIKVMDQGNGIDQETKEKVFSTTAATTHKGTNNETGTGFGMPIVKTLMEKMSGQVIIQNRIVDDKVAGAEVILTFPVSRSGITPESTQAKSA